MSVRTGAVVGAVADGGLGSLSNRLSAVLAVGIRSNPVVSTGVVGEYSDEPPDALAVGHVSTTFKNLRLSGQQESETGPKAKRKLDDDDRLQAMGLHLANNLYPTALAIANDRTFQHKQLFAMATYYLFRTNYGSAGVVWSGKDFGNAYDATVLFIADTKKYGDQYLKYVQAQNGRINKPAVLQNELPEIMYEHPANRDDALHLKYLEGNDLKNNSNYTNLYESPASKVYVFFKLKTTDQRPTYGPYLFLGRFMAMEPLRDQGKNQIRLKYYDPPLSAKMEYHRMNVVATPPSQPTIVQSDVDSVITSLSKASSKKSTQSKQDRRALPAASRDVEAPPTPPPRLAPRVERPANGPRVPTPADDELEDGEIRE